MAESLSDKSISAFLWVGIDKLGASSVNLVVAIILARLLSPLEFGLVAMVMIFFELSTVFIQSGFSYALIREKEISALDKSTTFVFNFIVSLVLYGVLYYTAPLIAAFFEQPILQSIVRVMGLTLIINAFVIIQQTVLTQQIDFKTQTYVRFGAVVFSGLIAVGMALYGFGVWSLVAKIILMELVVAVLLWRVSPWRLQIAFSRRSFKKLFGFGSILLIETLIDRFFKHALQIIIGKLYSATTLGYFAQANTYCNMLANNFLQAVQKVTYPVLAKLKDDLVKLKKGYRQIIMMSSFIIVPMLVLLGVVAEPFIVTLIGAQWLPSVPFLQLLCAAGITYHLNAINLDMLLVLGRVDLGLKLEVIKKSMMAVAIFIGLPFGIMGLVTGQVISHYLALIINTYYSKKLLQYSLSEQLSDIAPSLMISLLMGVLVFGLLQVIPWHGFLLLAACTFTGITFYLGLHYLIKTEEIQHMQAIIIPKTIRFITKLI